MKMKLAFLAMAAALCATMTACSSTSSILTDDEKSQLKAAATSALEEAVGKIKDEVSKE